MTDWINDQLLNVNDPLEKVSMILKQANAAISTKTFELQALENESFSYLPTVIENLIPDLIQETKILAEKCSKCIIDESTNSELKELIMLDLIVSRMEKTSSALKEAEKWTSFALEMDAIFDSGEYEKAAQRLEDASASLDLLSATPEYEDRKQILHKFQNKLESYLVSKIHTSYSARDTESMARLYEMYKCIQKGSKFIQLLNESRAALVMEEWQSFDVNVHLSFESFVNWITHFLMNTLYESLVADSIWIINIIPNPEIFQLDYLGHVFIKLGPEFQQRILKMYEKNPSIKGVKDVYDVCVVFGSNVEKYLQNLDSNNSIDVFEVGKWGLDLYKCFIPFQEDYVTYEREYVLNFLSNKLSDSIKTKNYLDMVRVLPETVSELLNFVKDSFERCGSLTMGLNSVGLVQVLNDYFCTIVERFSKILLQIRSETDVDDLGPKNGPENVVEGALSRNASSEFEDFEIRNGDMGRQEWADFQLGLRILGANLQLETQIYEFQESVLFLISHAEFKMGKSQSFDGPLWNSNEASSLAINGSDLSSESQWSKIVSLRKKSIFEPCLKEITSFSVKSQKYIYDTLFVPIHRLLSSIPSMDIWQSLALTNPSPFDLELPNFSLSPLEYITRIGEHLLCLPQQLDLYMDDPSLSVSLSTLPWIDQSTLDGFKDDHDEIDATHVWITSVCRGTFTLYLEIATCIPSMSKMGKSQLHTDMGYLVNILSAMDIEPSQSFSEFHKSLTIGS